MGWLAVDRQAVLKSPSRPPLLAAPANASLRLLAACGPWLLAMDGSTGAVGIVARANVLPVQEHANTNNNTTNLPPPTSSGPHATQQQRAVVLFKMDRVAARWRKQQAAALTVGDVRAYEVIKNHMGQLEESRRLQEVAAAQEAAGEWGAGRTAAVVLESVLQLIEGTSQASSGVLAPRTDGDELASELNCGIMQLLGLHVTSEQRLLRGLRVPVTASQSLAQSVAMGLHGGPSVHRDFARDVSALLARTALVDVAAAEAAAAAGGGSSAGMSAMARAATASSSTPFSPYFSSGAAATRDSTSDPCDDVVQLIVDIDAASGVRNYGQPVDLFISVYDGLNGTFLSDEARVFVDAAGRLCAPPGTEFQGQGRSDAGGDALLPLLSPPAPRGSWAQSVFLNVPRPLVVSGRCFIVFRAFRLGPLKESAAMEAAANASSSLSSASSQQHQPSAGDDASAGGRRGKSLNILARQHTTTSPSTGGSGKHQSGVAAARTSGGNFTGGAPLSPVVLPPPVPLAPTVSVPLGVATGTSGMKALALEALASLIRGRRTDTAVYTRPLGVGVVPVPAALCRLAEGTPHRPPTYHPLTFFRPSKGEDTRFFGLHKLLITEMEGILAAAGAGGDGAGAVASGGGDGSGGSGSGSAQGSSSNGAGSGGGGNISKRLPGGSSSVSSTTSSAAAAAAGGLSGDGVGAGGSEHSGAAGSDTALSLTSSLTFGNAVQLTRTAKLNPFPVVLRLASRTHGALLADSRFKPVLSSMSAEGGAAARPLLHVWTPPKTVTWMSSSTAAADASPPPPLQQQQQHSNSTVTALSSPPSRAAPPPGAATPTSTSSSIKSLALDSTTHIGDAAGGGVKRSTPSRSILHNISVFQSRRGTASASAAASAAAAGGGGHSSSAGLSTIQEESTEGGSGRSLRALSNDAGTDMTDEQQQQPAHLPEASSQQQQHDPSTTATTMNGSALPSQSQQRSGAAAAAALSDDGRVASVVVTSVALNATPSLFRPPSTDTSSVYELDSEEGGAAAPPRLLEPPSLLRDDLYVTIRKGTFSQDKKIAPRNIQVRLNVLLENGEVLPCMHRGVPADIQDDHSPHPQQQQQLNAAQKPATMMRRPLPSQQLAQTQSGLVEFRSTVFYHSNAPTYDETLCIRIPSGSQFERAHLLFTFWHASSQETRTHVFAFAFMPLADTSGAVVRDGRHVLRCYKALAGMEEGLNGPAYYLVAPIVDAAGTQVLPGVPPPAQPTSAQIAAYHRAQMHHAVLGASSVGGGGGNTSTIASAPAGRSGAGAGQSAPGAALIASTPVATASVNARSPLRPSVGTSVSASNEPSSSSHSSESTPPLPVLSPRPIDLTDPAAVNSLVEDVASVILMEQQQQPPLPSSPNVSGRNLLRMSLVGRASGGGGAASSSSFTAAAAATGPSGAAATATSSQPLQHQLQQLFSSSSFSSARHLSRAHAAMGRSRNLPVTAAPAPLGGPMENLLAGVFKGNLTALRYAPTNSPSASTAAATAAAAEAGVSSSDTMVMKSGSVPVSFPSSAAATAPTASEGDSNNNNNNSSSATQRRASGSSQSSASSGGPTATTSTAAGAHGDTVELSSHESTTSTPASPPRPSSFNRAAWRRSTSSSISGGSGLLDALGLAVAARDDEHGGTIHAVTKHRSLVGEAVGSSSNSSSSSSSGSPSAAAAARSPVLSPLSLLHGTADTQLPSGATQQQQQQQQQSSGAAFAAATATSGGGSSRGNDAGWTLLWEPLEVRGKDSLEIETRMFSDYKSSTPELHLLSQWRTTSQHLIEAALAHLPRLTAEPAKCMRALPLLFTTCCDLLASLPPPHWPPQSLSSSSAGTTTAVRGATAAAAAAAASSVGLVDPHYGATTVPAQTAIVPPLTHAPAAAPNLTLSISPESDDSVARLRSSVFRVLVLFYNVLFGTVRPARRPPQHVAALPASSSPAAGGGSHSSSSPHSAAAAAAAASGGGGGGLPPRVPSFSRSMGSGGFAASALVRTLSERISGASAAPSREGSKGSLVGDKGWDGGGGERSEGGANEVLPMWPLPVTQRLPLMLPVGAPEFASLPVFETFLRGVMCAPALHHVLLPTVLVSVWKTIALAETVSNESTGGGEGGSHPPALHPSSSPSSSSSASTGAYRLRGASSPVVDTPRSVLQALRAVDGMLQLGLRSFQQHQAIQAMIPAASPAEREERLRASHGALRASCLTLLRLLLRVLALRYTHVQGTTSAPSAAAALPMNATEGTYPRLNAAGSGSSGGGGTAWLITAHSIVCRLIVPLCSRLCDEHGLLSRVEVTQFLGIALGVAAGMKQPSQRFQLRSASSSSSSVSEDPAFLANGAVPQLLMLRDLLRLGFVDESSSISSSKNFRRGLSEFHLRRRDALDTLTPVIIERLLVLMNTSCTNRALSIGVVAALAARITGSGPRSSRSGNGGGTGGSSALDTFTYAKDENDAMQRGSEPYAGFPGCSRSSWCLSLLLSELSVAVGDLLAGRPTAADFASWRAMTSPQHAHRASALTAAPTAAAAAAAHHTTAGAGTTSSSSAAAAASARRGSASASGAAVPTAPPPARRTWRLSEYSAVMKAHSSADLPVPRLVPLAPASIPWYATLTAPPLPTGSSGNAARWSAAVAQSDALEVLALPDDAYVEAYGPLPRWSSASSASLSSSTSATTSTSSRAPGGIEGLAHHDPQTAAEMAVHVESGVRTAVSALISVVLALPDAMGPYILATLSPLRHVLGSLLPPQCVPPHMPPHSCSTTSLSPGDIEVHRIVLTLQMMNTGMALLAIPSFPASWLSLNMALHTAVFRLFRWSAGVLASCYSGSAPTSASDGEGEGNSNSSHDWRRAAPAWQAFVDLTIALLTSPLYAPESLSMARRASVLARYGDRRPAVCRVFRTVWGGALLAPAQLQKQVAHAAISGSVGEVTTAPVSVTAGLASSAMPPTAVLRVSTTTAGRASTSSSPHQSSGGIGSGPTAAAHSPPASTTPAQNHGARAQAPSTSAFRDHTDVYILPRRVYCDATGEAAIAAIGSMHAAAATAFGGGFTQLDSRGSGRASRGPESYFATADDASSSHAEVPMQQQQLSSGLCYELKLAMADRLVGPALDLTHCVCPDVATLARDLYMDLIRAELTLSSASTVGAVTIAAASPPPSSSLSSSSSAVVLNEVHVAPVPTASIVGKMVTATSAAGGGATSELAAGSVAAPAAVSSLPSSSGGSPMSVVSQNLRIRRGLAAAGAVASSSSSAARPVEQQQQPSSPLQLSARDRSRSSSIATAAGSLSPMVTARQGDQSTLTSSSVQQVQPSSSTTAAAAAVGVVSNAPSRKSSTVPAVATATSALLASPIGEVAGGLPLIERLTIDAIDILVQRRGPTLVIPRARPISYGRSGRPPRAQLQTSASSAADASAGRRIVAARGPTPTEVEVQPSPAAAAAAAASAAGDISPSLGARGTHGSGQRGTSAQRATQREERHAERARLRQIRRHDSANAYVPPPDNLIMSLFAPPRGASRRRRAVAAAVAGEGGEASHALDTADGAVGHEHTVGAGGDERRKLSATAAAAAASAYSGSSSSHSGGTTTFLYRDLLAHRTVAVFLAEIRTLYAMLHAVSRYPSSAEYEEERSAAALTLISYLRRTHRLDLYTKYVAFLTEQHARAGNAAEAALSYLLHADVLSWADSAAAPIMDGSTTSLGPGRRGGPHYGAPSPSQSRAGGGANGSSSRLLRGTSGLGGSSVGGPPSGDPRAPAPLLLPPARVGLVEIFPAQTPAQRLEEVLSKSFSDLAAAGCWEEAVRLGELLAARYEHVTSEYSKLAVLLHRMAGLYEDIARKPRLYPSYFLVTYVGEGFPRALQGKAFVYRGALGERTSEFEGRLLGKWGQATKVAARLVPVGSQAAAAPAPSSSQVEVLRLQSVGTPPAAAAAALRAQQQQQAVHQSVSALTHASTASDSVATREPDIVGAVGGASSSTPHPRHSALAALNLPRPPSQVPLAARSNLQQLQQQTVVSAAPLPPSSTSALDSPLQASSQAFSSQQQQQQQQGAPVVATVLFPYSAAGSSGHTAPPSNNNSIDDDGVSGGGSGGDSSSDLDSSSSDEAGSDVGELPEGLQTENAPQQLGVSSSRRRLRRGTLPYVIVSSSGAGATTTIAGAAAPRNAHLSEAQVGIASLMVVPMVPLHPLHAPHIPVTYASSSNSSEQGDASLQHAPGAPAASERAEPSPSAAHHSSGGSTSSSVMRKLSSASGPFATPTTAPSSPAHIRMAAFLPPSSASQSRGGEEQHSGTTASLSSPAASAASITAAVVPYSSPALKSSRQPLLPGLSPSSSSSSLGAMLHSPGMMSPARSGAAAAAVAAAMLLSPSAPPHGATDPAASTGNAQLQQWWQSAGAALSLSPLGPLLLAPANPALGYLGIGESAGGGAAPSSSPPLPHPHPLQHAQVQLGSGAPRVPHLIRQGRENAGVRHFLQQRPFRVRTHKSNEFLDLWISRVYVTSAEAFPSVSRRSRVIGVHEVMLNPAEVAVLALREKNASLLDVIERSAAGPDRGAEQDFSSKLQGVVDAAVSGGVANYRPFLTGTFAATHPEIAADLAAWDGMKVGTLSALRTEVLEQLRIVARGIRVHAVKCSTNMLPLHDFLCTRFEDMKKTVAELLGSS